MTIVLGFYHRLPGPARSVAATLRGSYLRGWRYGRDTDRLVAAAMERDRWTPAEWRAYLEARMAFILERAATRVPYYRDQWADRRRRGDRSSWQNLENWPILERQPLRDFPRAFVADDCRPGAMFHEHTSGTTGTSVDVWWSRNTVRTWYALTEARTRAWAGVTRHDRWGMLGGQLVTPIAQRRPPFWVWNGALNQLYLSSYHLAPDLISHYLDALERYRVRYLWGYTSSLFALADEALRQQRPCPQMRVVIANAEPVETYQRYAITRAFGCPVRETYGMAEIVAAASECEEGRLHVWPEVGHIEVLEETKAVEARGAGDLVCTSLLNGDMPLVRYRVGDRGSLSACEVACSCGRSLPVMASVEGRADDVLLTRDGRRIGRLDPVFKNRQPVREAQIIQESLDRVRVRYVAAPGFTAESGAALVDQVKSRLGDVEVVLDRVDQIPRTPNGKFRAVVSQLSDAERHSIRRT